MSTLKTQGTRFRYFRVARIRIQPDADGEDYVRHLPDRYPGGLGCGRSDRHDCAFDATGTHVQADFESGAKSRLFISIRPPPAPGVDIVARRRDQWSPDGQCSGRQDRRNASKRPLTRMIGWFLCRIDYRRVFFGCERRDDRHSDERDRCAVFLRSSAPRGGGIGQQAERRSITAIWIGPAGRKLSARRIRRVSGPGGRVMSYLMI